MLWSLIGRRVLIEIWGTLVFENAPRSLGHSDREAALMEGRDDAVILEWLVITGTFKLGRRLTEVEVNDDYTLECFKSLEHSDWHIASIKVKGNAVTLEYSKSLGHSASAFLCYRLDWGFFYH